MKHPSDDDTCFRIDDIDHVVNECLQENRYEYSLEACLV